MPKRVSLKGKGADLFFGGHEAPPPAEADEAEAPVPEQLPAESRPPAPPDAAADTPSGTTRDASPEAAPASPPRARTPRRRPAPATKVSTQASAPASVLASSLANDGSEEIQAIRRVVKTPGREVSFVRLSPEEKGQLADVVHTFKRQGVKTTETEINRIAINFLLADYRANGEQSVLAKVLAALQA